MKKLSLGISITVTGPIPEIIEATKEAGLKPHSMNYSLGIWGKKELLPSKQVLEITTMCGHHMLPAKIVERTMNQVKNGNKDEKEATWGLAKYCKCGITNPIRVESVLKKIKNRRNFD